MLPDGQRDLQTGAWWLTVVPGLAIFLTVLSFNLVGDGLRDALDPRHRRRWRARPCESGRHSGRRLTRRWRSPTPPDVIPTIGRNLSVQACVKVEALRLRGQADTEVRSYVSAGSDDFPEPNDG